MKPEIKVLVILFCITSVIEPLLAYSIKGNLILSFGCFGLWLTLIFALLITGEAKKIGLYMELKSIWIKILISIALFLEGWIFIHLSTEWKWASENFTAVLFSIEAIVVLYIGRRIFSFLK